MIAAAILTFIAICLICTGIVWILGDSAPVLEHMDERQLTRIDCQEQLERAEVETVWVNTSAGVRQVQTDDLPWLKAGGFLNEEQPMECE